MKPTTDKRSGRAAAGFTILELLVILAVIGIIGTIGVMNGRRIVQGQESRAAMESVRQSVWQGATLAAARGIPTVLVRTSAGLEVRNAQSGAVLRRFELPAGTQLSLPANPGLGRPAGTVLAFTPPGKVDPASLAALPQPFTLTIDDQVYRLKVSLIGEIQAERES
jgi:type II secretory pathway pseudopilin PulG